MNTHEEDYREFCKKAGFNRPQYLLKPIYSETAGWVYVRDREAEKLEMGKGKTLVVPTGKYEVLEVEE